jgi:hypothetical protein
MGFGFGPPLVSRGNGAFRPPPLTGHGNGFCHGNGPLTHKRETGFVTEMGNGFWIPSSAHHITSREWIPGSQLGIGFGCPSQNAKRGLASRLKMGFGFARLKMGYGLALAVLRTTPTPALRPCVAVATTCYLQLATALQVQIPAVATCKLELATWTRQELPPAPI